MRLFLILSFYDEDPAWLSATIASTASVGVDHVVAVDGAYDLLTDGRRCSATDQHAAILETATGAQMGATISVPQTTWQGNEIEKRSACFALAESLATAGDWYFVLDADEVVSQPVDLKARLAEVEEDVCEVAAWERPGYERGAYNALSHYGADVDEPEVPPVPVRTRQGPSGLMVRKLFRALPGLRVEGNHWTYMTGDGRKLWGNAKSKGLAACHDLGDLRVEHRTWQREKTRKEQQEHYYRDRRKAQAETPPCDRCGDALGTVTCPIDFRFLPSEGLHAHWTEVCEPCAKIVMDKNRRRLDYLRPQLEAAGITPEALRQNGVKAYNVRESV